MENVGHVHHEIYVDSQIQCRPCVIDLMHGINVDISMVISMFPIQETNTERLFVSSNNMLSHHLTYIFASQFFRSGANITTRYLT